MSRSSERLTAVGAVVLIVVAAIVTLVVLSDARDRGVEALEESQSSEVAATARSFNQRQINQLTSAQSILADLELDFTLGGDDQEQLDELLELFEGAELRTGFFLIDPSMTVTAGILLTDESIIGETHPRAEELDALIADPRFFEPPLGGILPVGAGITTNLPVTATLFPVFDPANPATGPLGFLVSETDVSSDSDLTAEIVQLPSDETDRWRFVDQEGLVVASSDVAELANPLPDDELLDLGPGQHDVDGNVVVVDDVPATGWRVVFSQDREEFEGALTGPLQNAGTVLVGVLLLVGSVIVVVLVRQLRAAREEQRRLRELNESREEFMSIVSHELRTPVAGVLGFLQTTIDHWDEMPEIDRQAAVRRAASNARRLQGLTRDVLDTESLESGELSYVFDDADLRDEVNAGVEAAQDLNPSRVFEVDLPTTPVTARIDPDRIQQVLTNLLDNADKNSPADQPVEIELGIIDDHVRLTVRDHGPGLDGPASERIFDKFVRGRGQGVTGTGLGLYISRRIVEAHDGRIWVDLDAGPGATFHVELPVSTTR